ncbi:M67 family metallopeptidase [Bacillus sp. IB182487]|uniref:M67 family metallopeptidase n=2 Tax=Metabacillus arenae TaxID=2771434 RepID=A0A926NJH6_9BACI|nr:M67 family metallopeptidase [Metabacillus arenae]
MINHCRSELPNEACGLISGINGYQEKVWEISNVNKSPYSFEMDSVQVEAIFNYFNRKKETVTGIYHSHPTADPFPSLEDVENIIYPEIPYFIVSFKTNKPDVKGYLINGNKIVQLHIRLY